MSNSNPVYGEHTEMVDKLLDLLTLLEEHGNTIINDIKESTEKPIIKEKMKEKIKKFNELFNKINTILNISNLNCLVSKSKYESIIQFIELHNKILEKEQAYNSKISSLAHDLNEISKTNQKIEVKKT
ncbi:hypothetical protein BCR32DRAFT_265054 [Anaeromyces robustus]|uniref:Uncharacterized protein n=1 Tax=Anaeromyces robustus TaxID=1754192 RepID=A0A1Y1XLZ7_9FUNG|nr:hypothetical protein BCR32DRAFT_265054 [Anaeromyces robustus]|eukprot:ORX86364.1 hypothetical protein BCR32DRAFT_265054 [Anaeromyces robustus]